MKNVIQIIYVQPVTGTSRKSGAAYDLRLAQCIVERTDDSGNPAPLVGELMLPEKFKDTVPGRYEVTFELMVGSDKRIGSRVSEMTPLPRPVAAAPQRATEKA